MTHHNKQILTIILIFIIALCALAWRAYVAIYGVNYAPTQEEFTEVTITPGMSVQAIAAQLKERGIIESSRDFIISARLLLLDHSIQAGDFPLPYGRSNAELLNRLMHSGTNATLVTIPEGFTSFQIAGLLKRQIGLDSTKFMQAVHDTALLAQYGIKAPSFEGYLFPDSYNFYHNMKPSWVVQRMVRRFFQIYDSQHMARAARMGFTRNQVITLASIIEGEIKISEEGPLISAVYFNRLKRNMPLQADPTIQYILADRRRLFRSDLTIESLYNTYLHRGLPPGPVCNPGELAIESALAPAAVPYIFMVSQGDGSHAFNTTLADHLRSKVKLDSLRQALARSRMDPTTTQAFKP
jgi:UPF0755 protein